MEGCFASRWKHTAVRCLRRIHCQAGLIVACLFFGSGLVPQPESAKASKLEMSPVTKMPFDNNDEAPIIEPFVFHDSVTGNYFYVESDGRHVACISPDGKILWCRDPSKEAGLGPYRFKHPIIIGISRWSDDHEGKIGVGFNSSQFGSLDEKTGDFSFEGQD
jgi:hypothetical protein